MSGPKHTQPRYRVVLDPSVKAALASHSVCTFGINIRELQAQVGDHGPAVVRAIGLALLEDRS